MAIKTILFDLDGTLLPMDLDIYVENYIKALVARLAPRGYDPKELVSGLYAGITAMVKNDGAVLNEDVFWDVFAEKLSDRILDEKDFLEEFYRTDYQKIKECCGFDPRAVEIIKKLKAAGYRLALLTSPLYPMVATISRVLWAGLDPEDFELITTYENCHYSKPNPKYYREVLEVLQLDPAECLMVGNDAIEDVAAEMAGIPVFLHTDCLINKNGLDISRYPNGGFTELMKYLGV